MFPASPATLSRSAREPVEDRAVHRRRLRAPALPRAGSRSSVLAQPAFGGREIARGRCAELLVDRDRAFGGGDRGGLVAAAVERTREGELGFGVDVGAARL